MNNYSNLGSNLFYYNKIKIYNYTIDFIFIHSIIEFITLKIGVDE